MAEGGVACVATVAVRRRREAVLAIVGNQAEAPIERVPKSFVEHSYALSRRHGCDACRRQGYEGRTGVFELMTFNHKLRQMILQDYSAEDIQQEAIKHGMVEFRRAAMLKVAQGITSSEEVLRELPAEYLGLEV